MLLTNPLLTLPKTAATPRFTANFLQKLAKSIVEELKNQKLDETVVQNILNTDPTPEKSYSLWLASQLKKKQIRLPEDSNQLKTQLQEFTKIKRSPTFTGAKDINKYSIGDLYEITQKKDVEVSKTQQVKELIEKGNAKAKIVAKEGAFTLYEVTGAEEVTILGSNTNWCTTQLEAAEDNLSKGPIFIGYYQGNPYLQFNSEQCLNKKNEPIGDDKTAYTLLEMGFKHKIKATYSWVARNPNALPASLSLLAKDNDRNVRRYVALNPNTPPASLVLLSKDDDASVRWYVAMNPNTPPSSLSLLAKDTNAYVRYYVAQNPNTPPASLAKKTSALATQPDLHKTAHDDSAYERIREVEDEAAATIIYEYRDHVNDKGYRQEWQLVPFNRLKKIWQDYMKMGFVRDEAGLNQIADIIVYNVAAIQANTYLCAHESIGPSEYAEMQTGEEFPEGYFDINDTFFDDDNGNWRISDYGTKHLIDGACAIHGAATPEQKLQAIDRVLNVVHQRSDLASWFVEGGSRALSQLSQTPEKTKSGSEGIRVSRLNNPLLKHQISAAASTGMIPEGYVSTLPIKVPPVKAKAETYCWVYHPDYGFYFIEGDDSYHYRFFKGEGVGTSRTEVMPNKLYDDCNRGYIFIDRAEKSLQIQVSPIREKYHRELDFVPRQVLNGFRRAFPGYTVSVRGSHVASRKTAINQVLEELGDEERAIHQQHADPTFTTQNGKMMGKGTETEEGTLADGIPGSLLASNRKTATNYPVGYNPPSKLPSGGATLKWIWSPGTGSLLFNRATSTDNEFATHGEMCWANNLPYDDTVRGYITIDSLYKILDIRWEGYDNIDAAVDDTIEEIKNKYHLEDYLVRVRGYGYNGIYQPQDRPVYASKEAFMKKRDKIASTKKRASWEQKWGQWIKGKLRVVTAEGSSIYAVDPKTRLMYHFATETWPERAQIPQEVQSKGIESMIPLAKNHIPEKLELDGQQVTLDEYQEAAEDPLPENPEPVESAIEDANFFKESEDEFELSHSASGEVVVTGATKSGATKSYGAGTPIGGTANPAAIAPAPAPAPTPAPPQVNGTPTTQQPATTPTTAPPLTTVPPATATQPTNAPATPAVTDTNANANMEQKALIDQITGKTSAIEVKETSKMLPPRDDIRSHIDPEMLPDKPKVGSGEAQPSYETLVALLRRAANSLQDYCAEVNGDMNDPLALEIAKTIDPISSTLPMKEGSYLFPNEPDDDDDDETGQYGTMYGKPVGKPEGKPEGNSPQERLEYLRSQLQAECISQEELMELQDLVEYIEPGDVELLEAAGVTENEGEDDPTDLSRYDVDLLSNEFNPSAPVKEEKPSLHLTKEDKELLRGMKIKAGDVAAHWDKLKYAHLRLGWLKTSNDKFGNDMFYLNPWNKLAEDRKSYIIKRVAEVTKPDYNRKEARIIRAAMGNKEQALQKVVKILGENGIGSLVVGGVALQEYGCPRDTQDIDLSVSDFSKAKDLLIQNGYEDRGGIVVFDPENQEEIDLLQAGLIMVALNKVKMPEPTGANTTPEYCDLPTLIDLKIGSFLGAFSVGVHEKRKRDAQDARELIMTNQLPREFLQGKIHQEDYEYLWDKLHEEPKKLASGKAAFDAFFNEEDELVSRYKKRMAAQAAKESETTCPSCKGQEVQGTEDGLAECLKCGCFWAV